MKSKQAKNEVVYIFNPLEDQNLKEKVRLVIYDNIAKEFIYFEVIESLKKCEVEKNKLALHDDLKYKYQIENPDLNGKQWIDSKYGYQDFSKVERKLKKNQDNKKNTDLVLEYEFSPAKNQSQCLLVCFQSDDSKFEDSLIDELRKSNLNLLYIKNSYTSSPGYYLNERKSLPISDIVQKLILEVVDSISDEELETIFIGSNEGGFASLYHGYKFNANQIFAINPPVLLGDYLFKRSNKNNRAITFKSIFGNLNSINKNQANSILLDTIKSSLSGDTRTHIYIDEDKQHYRKHILPLEAMLSEKNLFIMSFDNKQGDLYKAEKDNIIELIRGEILN